MTHGPEQKHGHNSPLEPIPTYHSLHVTKDDQKNPGALLVRAETSQEATVTRQLLNLVV